MPDLCRFVLVAGLCAGFSLSNRTVAALDYVSLERGGTTTRLEGRVLVEALDGGLALQTADGVIWLVDTEELGEHSQDDKPFVPLKAEQVAEAALQELGPTFRVRRTNNYVICYDTSAAYAEWCGALYERLNSAFYSYWENQGVKLAESEFPLVAYIFKDKPTFARFCQPEIGPSIHSMIGYYSIRTNRVSMFDLTGLAANGSRVTTTAARINQILRRPQAERTVATIVHEATHQLAYNSGLQTRFADNPDWVSEGLAVYFETPDLTSRKGWRNVGGVNRFNLTHFRRYQASRPADSLRSLLTDDSRFRQSATARAAYGEGWALNYFLIRTRRKEYSAYLAELARQTPLVDQTAEERIGMFTTHFGSPEEVDQAFLRYMRRVN